MANRRDELLDAAIELLGEGGIRAVTHRAIDTAAGSPAGTTSNYFRTRDALLNAVVVRFAARERANWDEIAQAKPPTSPRELAMIMAAYAKDSVGPHRTLTLARYAILVESAQYPALREQLLSAGGGVREWFTHWLRLAGSADPGRDGPIILNYGAGVVLHQLAMPDPAFDPTEQLTHLIEALLVQAP